MPLYNECHPNCDQQQNCMGGCWGKYRNFDSSELSFQELFAWANKKRNEQMKKENDKLRSEISKHIRNALELGKFEAKIPMKLHTDFMVSELQRAGFSVRVPDWTDDYLLEEVIPWTISW